MEQGELNTCVLPREPCIDAGWFCPLFVPLQYNTCEFFPFLLHIFDPSIPPFSLSILSPCRPIDSMDFTFGGKYRLEEELAIGGCGSFSLYFETKNN